jgi:hypothetical protein
MPNQANSFCESAFAATRHSGCHWTARTRSPPAGLTLGDSLEMRRGDHDRRRPHGTLQNASAHKFYPVLKGEHLLHRKAGGRVVDLVAIRFAEIAPQRRPVGDSDFLKSPAYAEDGTVLIHSGIDQAHCHFIARRIERTCSRLPAAIAMRLDVRRTAGEHNSIQPADNRGDIELVAHRGYEDCIRPQERHRAQITFGDGLRRILRNAGATDDANKRPLCHD